MKIDLNKPHGVVYGHPYAAYEQNGHLYDGAGDRLVPEEPVQESKEELIQTVQANPEILDFDQSDAINYQERQAKDFLKGILREGPLTRTAIYKECEANNQNWDTVQKVFSDMGGEALKIKNGLFWKLKTE